MYMLYVDESGDCGLQGSPTRYFILTGIVIHELRWQQTINDLIGFRQRMRDAFGLKLREEFHASQFISRPGELQRITRNDRMSLIRFFARFLANVNDLSIINVVVDKQDKSGGYDVFEKAWTALIQRFENTISYRNFPGPANPDDKGMIFCDHTDDKKLMALVRLKRRYNPVPNQSQYIRGYRDMPLQYIVEDPNFRDSAYSYLIQAADLCAYVLKQWLAPNSYFKKKERGSTSNFWTRYCASRHLLRIRMGSFDCRQKKGRQRRPRMNPNTQTGRGSDSLYLTLVLLFLSI